MLYKKKLSKLIIFFCLLGLLSNTVSVFASEAPAAEETTATDAAPTPEPTPTIPPSYYEPIQTDETNGWPAGPAVYAESAIVMDADTGTILYAKNIDTQKYPASITKIMTTLIAIENSYPTERVVFSDNAIWGIERNSSHIGIRIGENLSMKDCLYGMMLASANEVCLAVAEHIGGDVDTFVAMMNEKAAALGCTNTNFTNPNGLPDENHYTSAHDMALIAKAAFENELFREVCSTEIYKIGITNKTGEYRWMRNHHKMMLEDSEYYYSGCLGGKTGYTQVALNTLVTYANKGEQNLICVSMRTNGGQVYLDTATMLDYGFQNFNNIAITNTKKTDYSAYLMPYPAVLFNCFSLQTQADLVRNVDVSVPIDTRAENVIVQSSYEDDLLKRNLTFNDYVVGKDDIHPPKGVHQLASLFEQQSARAVATQFDSSGITNIKGTATSFLDSFKALPSWKYPMLAFLALLLIIIIIKIHFAVKRSKVKKNKKKRQNQNM